MLPRHWDWLATQPGGASVALRKLVEEASRNPRAQQRARRDAAYRLATALVGNAPGYEEAIRALYAGHGEEFAAHIEAWPADVRRALEEMTATPRTLPPDALKVRDDAFGFPVAIARGFGALGSAQFRRQLLLILLFSFWARRASASALARWAASAMRAATCSGVA